jgi:hypothetical protein
MFQADGVRVTVLVENQVDMLLPDQASPLGTDDTLFESSLMSASPGQFCVTT